MTEKMDSRLRGNDRKNCGNDIRNGGKDKREALHPHLSPPPPQGGGDIRIDIEMTIEIASGLCPSQ
jgi:hypothetical protein